MMGHHDPLDDLSRTPASGLRQSSEIRTIPTSAPRWDMADMCEGKRWETDDALGIGELLSACKLAQLMSSKVLRRLTF
jgi:hypothetical protein